MYPECDDNILIYPELARYDLGDTLPIAFEVNWTPVHALSWVYEMPYNLHTNMPTLASTTPQVLKPPMSYFYKYGSSSSIVLFRVWIETPLQTWLTIWKQIIFPFFYSYEWYNGTRFMTFTIKVWLLHTDWTIDYIATKDYSTKYSYFSYSYNISSTRQASENYPDWKKNWWSNEVITWSWITTVEWDRIIVEYILATNGANGWYLILWTQTPINEREKIRPIQISID